jgi:hypothetical protein
MTDNFIDTALTLPFPELTEEEKQRLIERAAQDSAYEAAAWARAEKSADILRAKRSIKRLRALIGGGWIVEFEPRQHLGLQTSTRGERRRA